MKAGTQKNTLLQAANGKTDGKVFKGGFFSPRHSVIGQIANQHITSA